MNKNLRFQRKLLRSALHNRTLPKEVRSALPKLDGIFAHVLPPKNKKTQEKVVHGVAAVSAKLELEGKLDELQFLCSGGHPEFIVEGQAEITDDKLRLIANLAKASIRSRKVKQFFRLVSAMDIYGFLGRVKIFSGDRKVEFEEVPDHVQSVAKMICAGAKSDEEIKNLAKIVMKQLALQGTEFDYGEYYTGNIEDAFQVLSAVVGDLLRVQAILNQEYPEFCKKHEENMVVFSDGQDPWEYVSLLSKELLENLGVYRLFKDGSYLPLPFSQSFVLGNVPGYVIAEGELKKAGFNGLAFGSDMLFDSDEEMVIHHELQHVFDTSLGINDTTVGAEYRAFLSELVFTKDLSSVISREFEPYVDGIFVEMKIADALFKKKEKNIPSRLAHSYARYKIFKQLGELSSSSDLESIRIKSRELLNAEYNRLAGMSYDEIIRIFEPLAK